MPPSARLRRGTRYPTALGTEASGTPGLRWAWPPRLICNSSDKRSIGLDGGLGRHGLTLYSRGALPSYVGAEGRRPAANLRDRPPLCTVDRGRWLADHRL